MSVNRLRLTARLLLAPLWLAVFIVYFFSWYIRMSWLYFRFEDYWDDYLELWDDIMVKLRIK